MFSKIYIVKLIEPNSVLKPRKFRTILFIKAATGQGLAFPQRKMLNFKTVPRALTSQSPFAVSPSKCGMCFPCLTLI